MIQLFSGEKLNSLSCENRDVVVLAARRTEIFHDAGSGEGGSDEGTQQLRRDDGGAA